MAKRVAVLAVNPVNGLGLFQYLEAFYENQIPYTVYAVAETPHIKTNSGMGLTVQGTVADLKGHETEFDALVFSCGDAVPVFQQHASEPCNVDMMEVIRRFGKAGKVMIGHCAAALMFDMAGITHGERLALHPMVQGAVQHGTATNEPSVVDGRFLTAQTENTLWTLMPQVIETLKA